MDPILNNRARLALRTLQSGMQTGITSPARPWFRLIPADHELSKRLSVQRYLENAQIIMRQAFQTTGTYNALHVGYGDLGLFGTDAMLIDSDPDTAFVLHVLVPGTYWLGANRRGEIDTLYLEDVLTVEQIVTRFVFNTPTSEPDWTRVSNAVRNLWDRGDRYAPVPVARLVAPRLRRDPHRLTPDNKPVQSAWWEIGHDAGNLLRDSGYDFNPIIASRWQRDGYDVWGTSPAMDALPEVKMLQVAERDKNEAIRRMNRPPMNAPTSMRNTPFSTEPGAVNFTDDPNGLRPAFEVNPPIQHMQDHIREIEERIDELMYANLFMMLARSDRRQITAREIEERHSEKLLGLGPVLELQHREKLQPLIRAAYRHLEKAGKLPPTPEELDGRLIEVDYISIMAQAQKAVGTAAVERLFGFAGNLAAVFPGVIDKLDADRGLENYADMLGTSPELLRDGKLVEELRSARAQEQRAMQAAEAINKAGPGVAAAASAARVLSESAIPRGPQPRDVLNRIGVGII
jgi:hypothetical protein